MISTKYYAGMPKETRNDGSAMMRAYESVQAGKGGKDAMVASSKVICLNSAVQENHV
jgi:hypothetical protein